MINILYYMQLRKNMVQYLMFLYAFIIFLSLFVVQKAQIYITFFTIFSIFVFYTTFYHLTLTTFFSFHNAGYLPCSSDDDCPKEMKPVVVKCIHNFCEHFMVGEYEGP
ncbi:Nodule Cysteine-Rich (NCR) secreted peptide [Medicago truncatula]|uniref:Nodule Cysteine-Rich (NCR) secreted peptide n=1 Tax=Medicago truncatula TaxID=3880 RepID=A0A072UL23_MEDTR|nr:Nodule Cysteine-Rich (NCR) secreted peptide [Medicago truncatula]